jgi:hypothetical protein
MIQKSKGLVALIKGEIKKINLKNNNSIVRCQNFKRQIKE